MVHLGSVDHIVDHSVDPIGEGDHWFMVEPLTDRHAALPAQVLQQAAGTFGMLAATARLQIVWLLAKGERDVGTLAAEVGSTVPAVSQHLAKLKLAGLVRSRREGRRQVYLVDDPQVAEMVTSMVRLHQGIGGLGADAESA
ncbi:MAG TPA: metalloregulator ArsR/SmtB family transcription factor [Pseudonocardiaceae bacterium]|jgi:DNA-binding transcriptional ArsR family regulator|nr:metalloregulator ArsR/SmtB family transcription factor [Pseudonocardiaceae bacterium]